MQHTQEGTGDPRGRSLRDLHMRVWWLFQAQRAFLRPRFTALGMGPGQPKLLVYIAVHGPSTQRQIAEYFETDPASVSRMLDGLAHAGLVEARRGQDRRTRVLTVTERGLAAAASWDLCCDEETDAMLAGFSPEECEQFAGFLERAHANLRAASAAEQGEARHE